VHKPIVLSAIVAPGSICHHRHSLHRPQLDAAIGDSSEQRTFEKPQVAGGAVPRAAVRVSSLPATLSLSPDSSTVYRQDLQACKVRTSGVPVAQSTFCSSDHLQNPYVSILFVGDQLMNWPDVGTILPPTFIIACTRGGLIVEPAPIDGVTSVSHRSGVFQWISYHWH
jgi:hypothetical protein